MTTLYRVDYTRHGFSDYCNFRTLADAESFVRWGEGEGVFIRPHIQEPSLSNIKSGVTVRDYGYEAHQAAKTHLAAVQEAFDVELEGAYEDGDGPQYPTDMAGPFDGCDDCVIREVLHAAWPLLLLAAREEEG